MVSLCYKLLKSLKNKKALSPVIAAIILIAVTVAVSIAAATWMGSISFSFMKVDELTVSATHGVQAIPTLTSSSKT